MTMLEQLKFRIEDAVVAFTDPQLQSIIDNVKAQYSLAEATEPETILDLAQAKVCLILAQHTATYFKYTQNTESVDKTKTPEQFRQLAKTLLEPHAELVKSGGKLTVLTQGTPKEFAIDWDESGEVGD